MESRTDFQQCGKLAGDRNFTGGRRGDAGEQFQQRAFSRAIGPDDTYSFSPRHLEADIAKRPEDVRRRETLPQPRRKADGRRADMALADQVSLRNVIEA